MARLRGHATNPPGRWKEPGAVPATDHAAQRARQGRGRRRIRRRVRRQCREGGSALGSVIPHAGPVRPLVIAMIEPAFRTATMAVSESGRQRPIPSASSAKPGTLLPILNEATGAITRPRSIAASNVGCESSQRTLPTAANVEAFAAELVAPGLQRPASEGHVLQPRRAAPAKDTFR